MRPIEVENNSSDKRTGAVLASAHSPYSVGMNRDALNVVVADGVRKIEQNAVRVGCSLR
jgi:hypothetical protein